MVLIPTLHQTTQSVSLEQMTPLVTPMTPVSLEQINNPNSYMNFLVWNCRGSHNPEFRHHFRSLLDNHRPVLAILLETHMHNHTRLSDDYNFTNMSQVSANGLMGGLVVLWNEEGIKVIEMRISDQEIHCMVQIIVVNNNLYNIFLKHTTQQAVEYTYLAAFTHKTNHKRKITKKIKWNPPNTNFYKLNTDGAYSANTVGIGGLIRNSKAEWILGFSGSAPHDSSTTAELYALTQGLKLAYENNIRPLEMEVDVKEVTMLLHTNNIAFSCMIIDCRYYLGQLGNPVVQYAYKEQNMVADQLAKAGHNFGNDYTPSVFEDVPTFVAQIFEKDKECLAGPPSCQGTA
ncbi:uncharacterized protein [Nicotiana sylvestris]|uniref:Uncharacterized protein LOC104221568 n=1 Tax=Nicotiana sylvestris TaxID=4096 RepID=A0A1U7W8E8_NICSY|nr:PREDICTED: uncharacterized protein LOC104221568 [Nicotiana sylvestris]